MPISSFFPVRCFTNSNSPPSDLNSSFLPVASSRTFIAIPLFKKESSLIRFLRISTSNFVWVNILFEGVNDKITYKEFYNLCLNFKNYIFQQSGRKTPVVCILESKKKI